MLEMAEAVIKHVFLDDECFQHLLTDGVFMTSHCWQLLMSKVLSSIIIITASFVQIPQLLAIIGAHSGEGVDLTSHLMILLTHIFSIPYCIIQQFPLSVWGETILMALQTLATATLILWYSHRRLMSALLLILAATAFMCLLSPAIPITVHQSLQVLSMPLIFTAKLSQIRKTYILSDPGQLSILTVCGLNFRSLARFFTFAKETGDPYKMTIMAIASILNFTTACQILYYRNAKKDTAKKGR